LRGALKGCFKHGACMDKLFPELTAPDASGSVKSDWWLDALKPALVQCSKICGT